MKKTMQSGWIPVLGLCITVLALLAFALAAAGNRMDFWHFRTSLLFVFIAMIGGFAGAAVSIIGIIVQLIVKGNRGFLPGIIGIVLGLAVAWGPWSLMQYSRSIPRIHDITTDTIDPPSFVDILPLRKNAANKPEYEGGKTAALQEKAYPDIKPLLLTVTADEAFDRSAAVARSMGWKIVTADKKNGRIEATATTFWMGFKDDIVIRVAKSGDGSRVDIRSESRVGIGDFGTNAVRIKAFLKAMQK